MIKPFKTELNLSETSELIKGTNSLAAVMPDIAAVIEASIDENFRVGGRYGTDNEYGGGSNKWPPLKYRKGLPLTDKGNLKNVNVFASGNLVRVSSPRVDLLTHNFGDRRDNKVWPPRPIVVVQEDDIEEIEHVIEEHIKGITK